MRRPMDTAGALEFLKGGERGIAQWNGWRQLGEEIPDLSQAELAKADLHNANLSDVDFVEADLEGANLTGADLSLANLSRANLKQACLAHASFLGTEVEGANFEGALFSNTLVACDFSRAAGLERANHMAQSWLTFSALRDSEGSPPERFLRGCGLSDEDIAYFRSRVGSAQRLPSCFISYGAADEEFATRLYDDFQAAGIRCWKWDHDARVGRDLWGEIDAAIHKHPKLVLIASESSLKSPAVNSEIERAIQKEHERFRRKQGEEPNIDADVLFPVRLDDFILTRWNHPRKADVIKKVIADACGCDKDQAAYKRVIERLIRDLKSERTHANLGDPT